MRTRLTELLGIRYPIVQGGLNNLAYAELAAAVSNAGGLGQVTATSGLLREQAEAVAEVRRARTLTAQPFAVNFAIAERRRDLAELLARVLDEGVAAVSFTAGNPEPFIEQVRHLRGAEVKVLVLVAGVRQAQKAEASGADAVIAVGVEGGGHLGRDDVGTLVLVPRVVDSVRIPVVASGGIMDGRGLAAALALGAEGAELGTRFVATRECRAHEAYKRALVEAIETDTVIVERSIGRPARILKGPQATRILEAEAAGATLEELLPLISGRVSALGALEGDLEHGFVWASQGSGLIHDVPSVSELVGRLVAEARATLSRAAATLE
jgi:NAD(P)H-dependent flavin oxidoreductase YrpB (nitropropane dioxygenase family)